MFPIIHCIEDVLPHISGRDEFVHAKRDWYSVIDYNYALADSFDDPMRLECRGVKFSPDGSILARPLHKFWNLAEKPSTQPHLLDFSQPHVVTEKLDGSMIHPAIVNGEVVFMTRMGRTDVAKKAERHLTAALNKAVRYSPWITPIFEFTAPDNRIIIRYEESSLSLLAAREIATGRYMPQSWLESFAHIAGIPLVRHIPSDWNSGQAFLDYARAVTGSEGFVVRFASGLWVKAKGEDYVLKHKAKDSILHEKNVLALILSGGLDDVLPLLDDGDRRSVEMYRDAVSIGITKSAASIRKHVDAGAKFDQKEFAVEHQQKVDPSLRPLAFMVRAGRQAGEAVFATLLKSTGSQSSVDATRHLHGATWSL